MIEPVVGVPLRVARTMKNVAAAAIEMAILYRTLSGPSRSSGFRV